jgi:prevent-host-death family protein
MNPSWQLQEAKNRFSEVVEEALTHGPQTVTRHGREVVVVLSMEEFKRLKQPQKNIVQALMQIPQEYRVDLDISRAPDYGRDIEL